MSGRGRSAGRAGAAALRGSATGGAPFTEGTPSEIAKARNPPSMKAQFQPMVSPTVGTARPPSSEAVGMPDFWMPRARPWRRSGIPRAT